MEAGSAFLPGSRFPPRLKGDRYQVSISTERGLYRRGHHRWCYGSRGTTPTPLSHYQLTVIFKWFIANKTLCASIASSSPSCATGALSLQSGKGVMPPIHKGSPGRFSPTQTLA